MAANDPFRRLGRHERYSWRRAERQVRRAHERDQIEALRDLAAAGPGMTSLHVARPAHPLQKCSPAELIIAGRRVRAGRIHRGTLAKLKEGLSGIAAMPLTAVERYGPYWVLTFRLATEQLVVLAEHLTLLPEWADGWGGATPDPVFQLAG